MMNSISIAKLLVGLCLMLAAFSVRAQDTPVPPPEEAPPAAAKPEAKKANTRPTAPTEPAGEPFDKATATDMSGQCVLLETEAGAIQLEMLADFAPETVRNFLNLVATGAFDTTTFSRVVPGFVVQGGNLATRTKITPELAERSRRTILDEPNHVEHVRGIISMARPETPNGATTNFFILVGDGAHLNGKFAAFARVISGMDVADAINHAAVENEKPTKPVRLKRALVFGCPNRGAGAATVPPEE